MSGALGSSSVLGILGFCPSLSGGGGMNTSREGLVNNSILAWIHGCILAISVDEGKNATLAYQISNSTKWKGIFWHDVIFKEIGSVLCKAKL